MRQNAKEKHRRWHQKELEVPLRFYLLASVMIWLLLALLILVIDQKGTIVSMPTRKIVLHFLYYAPGGVVFGLAMRIVHYFGYKYYSK